MVQIFLVQPNLEGYLGGFICYIVKKVGSFKIPPCDEPFFTILVTLDCKTVKNGYTAIPYKVILHNIWMKSVYSAQTAAG